jgi:prepilin-type processing-associated H-X9-DG protein
VVLILLVIAGLVLPFVVRVREASRHMLCANNVKQLGIALADYHSALDRFPRGTVSHAELPPERRMSWLVEIRPFLVAEGLLLDKTKPWDDPKNLEPMGVGMGGEPPFVIGEWPPFLCPANPARALEARPGLTHYIGIAGLGENAAKLPKNDRRSGVFGYDRLVSLKDFKDGQASTFMLAETAVENGPWTAGGWPTLRPLIPERGPYLGNDGQFTSLHPVPGRWFGPSFPYATNVAFADGSVRSLKGDLDAAVVEALATIAGGKQVPPFEEMD